MRDANDASEFKLMHKFKSTGLKEKKMTKH